MSKKMNKSNQNDISDDFRDVSYILLNQRQKQNFVVGRKQKGLRDQVISVADHHVMVGQVFSAVINGGYWVSMNFGNNNSDHDHVILKGLVFKPGQHYSPESNVAIGVPLNSSNRTVVPFFPRTLSKDHGNPLPNTMNSNSNIIEQCVFVNASEKGATSSSSKFAFSNLGQNMSFVPNQYQSMKIGSKLPTDHGIGKQDSPSITCESTVLSSRDMQCENNVRVRECSSASFDFEKLVSEVVKRIKVCETLPYKSMSGGKTIVRKDKVVDFDQTMYQQEHAVASHSSNITKLVQDEQKPSKRFRRPEN